MLGNINLEKCLFLFEIDNVLIQKRDYLVQVYYLFGSFYEYTEGTHTANTIAQFMTKIYDVHGEDAVFSATKTMFNIDEKYEINYNRLLANAQIPIKLDLRDSTKQLLNKLIKGKKNIAILTKGNPIEQLNKIKFINWGDLSDIKNILKIYFKDELDFRGIEPIEFISKEFEIDQSDVEYINYS